MSRSFTAVLLAGGRSRRMGQDKAFLKVADHPLWRRQLEVLWELEPAQVLLSRNADQVFPQGERVEEVEDQRGECGPLGGVVSCLEKAEHERVLVLAVDLPFVTSEFLQGLLNEKGGVVLRDEVAGRFEAVVAVFTRGCLAIAEGRLARGELGMQGFISECVEAGLLRVVAVGEEERSLLRNWNRPEDVAE